uniref:Putative secreted protein n=1 Tax=Ixodes scapularis TaxID=6945 RepID=A0A4D5RXM5_IXOSC
MNTPFMCIMVIQVYFAALRSFLYFVYLGIMAEATSAQVFIHDRVHSTIMFSSAGHYVWSQVDSSYHSSNLESLKRRGHSQPFI